MIKFSDLKPFIGFGPYSEIYVEESDSLSIRWEDGRVQDVGMSRVGGAGLRALIDRETRFGHTNLAAPLEKGLDASEIERLKKLKGRLESGLSKGVNPSISEPVLKRHPSIDSPENHSLDEKIDLLKGIFKVASDGPLVRQVAMNYGERRKRIGFLNSDGNLFWEDRTYLVFSLTVTAERNGDLQTGYESLGGLMGYELFDPNRLKQLAIDVRERAHKKLDAPQAPVGEMPVVIASSAGGTLIHEAVGHSLEADAVFEGTSPSFAGKVGQMIANEKLTVLDDPTVPLARGSFYYDDEGTPSERTVLIDKGQLKTYLFDRKSAARAGQKSNGHARRESYAHRPIPRMSNTFVAPGPDNPQEILNSFKQGLLVTKMGGGQVNTANGDFVFEVEEGFHVNNGEKKMVRGATLLGNGPDVLKNIDMVGSDHGWAIGTCGKEGQGVPVSDALPTVRIKKMVIGGQ